MLSRLPSLLAALILLALVPCLRADDFFFKDGDTVVMLGDSITEGWGKAKEVWRQHYGKDDPANFGISGDRTEHVLWGDDLVFKIGGKMYAVVVLGVSTHKVVMSFKCTPQSLIIPPA